MTTCVVDFAVQQCPALGSFERNTRAISRFLGPPPSLLLSEACSSGTVATLDWIWAASCTTAKKRAPGWTLTNYLRSDRHYHRWQFMKSLLAAAERGDVAILEWLFAHFSGIEVSGKRLFKAAAERGHLRVYKFLWDRRSNANDDTSERTMRAESIQESGGTAHNPCTIRVKDTYDASYWGCFVVERATEYGRLVECLDDGLQLGDVDLTFAIRHALRLGNYKLAARLLPDGENLLEYCPWRPPPELVEKMLEIGLLRWNEERAADILADLAAKGRLDLVQQIFQLYSPLQEDHVIWQQAWHIALPAACTSGNLSMLQWLMDHPLGREEMKPCDDSKFRRLELFHGASSNGHVNVMQYLFNRGLFEDADVTYDMIQRVSNDPIDSIKWLVGHGLLSDQKKASYAIARVAQYGRLDILQLFQTLDSDGEEGSVGTKRKRTGWQFSIWGGKRDTYYWAASGGHVAVLQWLEDNYPGKCDVTVMNSAAFGGYLDVMKWLHCNRTEGCTNRAMYKAGRNGHFDVVKWLYANYPESRTPLAIAKAVENGHVRVAYWLSKKFPGYAVSQYSVDKLIYGAWHRKNTLEELIFLRDVHPSAFTPRFLEEVRGDYSKSGGRFTSDIILGWLDENFPRGEGSDILELH